MRVYIIAEAGVNHNGNIDLAKALIDAAKEAGADCVKFQTFKAENVVSLNTKKADYQKETTGEGTQIGMLKKYELSFEDFLKLKDYCDGIGISFLSTPFDIESIGFLNSIEMPFWKIPSGEITNYPYLVAIAQTRKPVVMSTGMCEMNEIEAAVNVLRDNGTENIKLLHCNTEYPTPFCDVNLKAINVMKETFGVEIGYSDHTEGIEIPIAAVALGATIIEKHFTLDRNMEGPDHKASLVPCELSAMVKCIRNIESALGDGKKTPSPSESRNIFAARKSIVAKTAIRMGEELNEANITVKRPGNGISPMRWLDVIGKRAIRDFSEDEMIEI